MGRRKKEIMIYKGYLTKDISYDTDKTWKPISCNYKFFSRYEDIGSTTRES